MGDDDTQPAHDAHDAGAAAANSTPDADNSPAGASTDDSGSTVTASADLAMMQRARARHGVAGALVAGGMLGLDKVLGRPAKEEIPVVWEAAGEPLDIDNTGITLPVDGERKVHSNPGAAERSDRRVVKRRR
jgi:hypothetical protein